MNSDRDILVRYRLDQAGEAVESAKILLKNDKLRSSINRSYYAMFYAVLALLAIEGLKPSKHSAVIGIFNREFVKKGIFEKEFSLWLQEAFDLRQRADYRELFSVSKERAKSVLEHAGEFIARVRDRIRQEGRI